MHRLLNNVTRLLILFRRVLKSSPLAVYETAFSFLPNGSPIRTAYQDTIPPGLQLIDVPMGLDKRWYSRIAVSQPPRAIAVLENSFLLAFLCSGTPELRWWDLKSLQQVNRLQSVLFDGDDAAVMAFLPDGRLLGTSSRLSHLWCVDKTFSHVETVVVDAAESLNWASVAFSQDLSNFAGVRASAGAHYLAIWTRTDTPVGGASFSDLSALDFEFTLQAQEKLDIGDEIKDPQWHIAWNPDSSRISIAQCHSSSTVQIFTLTSGTSLSLAARLPCSADFTVWSHRGDLLGCKAPESRISVFGIVESEEEQQVVCRHWDIAPPEEDMQLESLVFSPADPALLVGTYSHYQDPRSTTILVAMWYLDPQADDGNTLLLWEREFGYDLAPERGARVVFTLGNKTMALITDVEVLLLEVPDTTHLIPYSEPMHLSFSPEGQALAVARKNEKHVEIYSTIDGTTARIISTGHQVSGLAWQTDQTMLTFCDTEVQLYDLRVDPVACTGTIRPGESMRILACTFSPKNSRILLSAVHSLDAQPPLLQAIIYDPTSSTLVHSLSAGSVVTSEVPILRAPVAWSNTDYVAIGGVEGIRMWKLEGDGAHEPDVAIYSVPSQAKSRPGRSTVVSALAFSPSGAEISGAFRTGREMLVCVFDVESGNCLHSSDMRHYSTKLFKESPIARSITLSFSSDGMELYNGEGIV